MTKNIKNKIKRKILFKWLILFVGLLLFINLVVLGYFSFVSFPPKNSLRVVFFDIGQGDAALIQTPKGYNILIDGGPEKNIIHKLDKYIPINNRRIDLMILTHFGLDHLTGLVEVLERYPVKRVVSNGLKDNTFAALEWKKIIEQKNIPQQAIDATQRIVLEDGDGEIKMDFFWPIQNQIKRLKGDDNFTSLVLKLTYKNNSLLFTGDAITEAEEEIIKSGVNLKADVLKVGHHGSKYSSGLEFLKLVEPQYGVISVGENAFGHPSLRVLNNLKEVGAEILRTDELGDIIFLGDGEKIKLTNKIYK